MCHLNPVVMEQSAEESTDWDSEPVLEEGGEHDGLHLVLRPEIPIGRVLLQHHPWPENRPLHPLEPRISDS